jgi:hypothetical protein
MSPRALDPQVSRAVLLMAGAFLVACATSGVDGRREPPPTGPREAGTPNTPRDEPDGSFSTRPPCLEDGTHPLSEYGDPVCCGSPTELPGLSCVEPWLDGGVFGDFGRCLPEGYLFDLKFAGAVCCDGGMVSRAFGPAAPGDVEIEPGCTFLGNPSTGICTFCGDGICGEGESFCICEADCPRP